MQPDHHGGSRPVPDPTVLTTEQLMREINRLEEAVLLRAESGEARLTGQIDLTQERFEALRKSLDERFATQQFAISTAFEAAQKAKEDAKELFDAKLSSLTDMLNERYATQVKALDAAFMAQQAAVATSFDASEKAVAAAMLASDKAVEKANVANEKRFEGVNEFRAQLSDLISTFVPRTEIDAQMASLDARIGDNKTAIDKGFTGVNMRHETTDDQRETSRANIAIIIAVVGTFLTLILTIVTGLHIATH